MVYMQILPEKEPNNLKALSNNRGSPVCCCRVAMHSLCEAAFVCVANESRRSPSRCILHVVVKGIAALPKQYSSNPKAGFRQPVRYGLLRNCPSSSQSSFVHLLSGQQALLAQLGTSYMPLFAD